MSRGGGQNCAGAMINSWKIIHGSSKHGLALQHYCYTTGYTLWHRTRPQIQLQWWPCVSCKKTAWPSLSSANKGMDDTLIAWLPKGFGKTFPADGTGCVWNSGSGFGASPWVTGLIAAHALQSEYGSWLQCSPAEQRQKRQDYPFIMQFS